MQKAIDTPIFGQSKEQDEFERDLPREEVIDLEQEAHARNRVTDNVLKQSIHEANMKWHAQENEEFRSEAGKYALKFLKSMNGTLCYLFFLLYAAWVRSRAERPSVSYTKVVMEVAWTGHNLQFTKTN